MAKNTSILEHVSGPIRYPLTNDYMFHAVLQKNERVLKGLVCSLLGITEEYIQSLELKNPIQLGETVSDKDIILDIRILLNNNQSLDIEMQVANEVDWPKRSLFYLCQLFTSLKKGQKYKDIIPALHIGILNFTLFPDAPEFYAKNLMMNTKTHKIFSSDFALNVLDLKSIHLATNEDKSCKLDYWAKLFVAKTWEEIKMLAKNNDTIHEAVVTMCELSADDKIRMQCEARERYEGDLASSYDTGLKRGFEKGILQTKIEDILDLLAEYGPIPEELSAKIHAEENLETLKKWFKLAAKMTSIEDFISQM